jgi:hypothetical protein
MALNLNKALANPQMRDMFDLIKREILLQTNCHAIGTIQSFNPTTCTVDAKIAYSMVFQKRDPSSGTYSQVLKPYPPMVDLPVFMIGGGPVYFDQPFAAGDECVIMFNDRDLMNWYAGQPPGATATGRLHSFSDGIALVGIRNIQRALPNHDGVRGGITDGDAFVGVNPTTSLVSIKNEAIGTLNTVLGNIITQLETLANSVAVPGVPINAAVATELAVLAAQLGELIE